MKGWTSFTINEKLRMLKMKLRNWNREIFGNLDSKVRELEKKVTKWDLLGAYRNWSLMNIHRC